MKVSSLSHQPLMELAREHRDSLGKGHRLPYRPDITGPDPLPREAFLSGLQALHDDYQRQPETELEKELAESRLRVERGRSISHSAFACPSLFLAGLGPGLATLGGQNIPKPVWVGGLVLSGAAALYGLTSHKIGTSMKRGAENNIYRLTKDHPECQRRELLQLQVDKWPTYEGKDTIEMWRTSRKDWKGTADRMCEPGKYLRKPSFLLFSGVLGCAAGAFVLPTMGVNPILCVGLSVAGAGLAATGQKMTNQFYQDKDEDIKVRVALNGLSQGLEDFYALADRALEEIETQEAEERFAKTYRGDTTVEELDFIEEGVEVGDVFLPN